MSFDWRLIPGLVLSSILSSATFADGASLGKVYYPYVQPLEKELEYQALVLRDAPGLDEQVVFHQLGLGAGFSDYWYGEASLVWTDTPSFELEAYELEFRRQLTEQGEYAVDWGLMFELEKEKDEDAWEGAIGVLASTELNRWQYTSNLFVIREWGDDVEAEWESALALQAKYRYSAAFEPGIEFFAGEDTRAIGPVAQGALKLNVTDKLLWQVAWLFGAIDETPDQSFRLVVEYEFF